MTTFDPALFVPSEFSGLARLFPLPNLVTFPHAIQPLHVFEPRYRQLLTAALATDRLIGMALLKPVNENTYNGIPEIEPTVCLSKIISSSQMSDGRSNVLLCGVHRARIIEELDTERVFREAHVELVTDFYPADGAYVKLLRQELVRALENWLPGVLHRDDQFRKILDGEFTLGAMSDIIANYVPLDVREKQRLLDASDVEQRGLLLLDVIEELDVGEGGRNVPKKDFESAFPPRFSEN